MLIDDFNHTMDCWIEAIQHYSFEQLRVQPGANSWSLGQVCMHFVNDSSWFIEQIKICISNNRNAGKAMSPFTQAIFAGNSFPDEKLTNPSNVNIPQPESKETLLQLLVNLKNEMNNAAIQISNSALKGKTRHPGLHYFNANEWLQFAEMHLRHHLEQKKRIDEFLKMSSD